MITYQYTSPKGVKGKLISLAAAMPNHDDRVARGQAAWKALHEAAAAGTITPAWLAAVFPRMIPRFGCACRSKWQVILGKIPFRPHDQFAWSVEVHNAVNAELGKPKLTVEQARAAV